MKKLLILLLILPIFSCNKDEIKSSETDILNFSVAATDNFTPSQGIIDNNDKQIIIFSDVFVTADKYPVELVPIIETSEGASISPASGTSVSWSSSDDMVKYTVTSADGSNATDWFVSVRDNQIPNSDFENWHEKVGMNSKSFSDPGKYEESTVWATANMGTSSYGVYGTIPVTEGSNTLVQIETGTTLAVPITSGTLFLGKFDISGAISNPTNPEAATSFGIPFYYKPTAIKFKYKFQPGDQLVQATLKDPGNIFGGFTVENIAGTDEFKVFAKLEKRINDVVTLIGETGEYRSSATVSTLTELTLPIEYLSSDTPTHFYVVFASSADGNTYKGAFGSTLIIDDLELLYE